MAVPKPKINWNPFRSSFWSRKNWQAARTPAAKKPIAQKVTFREGELKALRALEVPVSAVDPYAEIRHASFLKNFGAFSKSIEGLELAFRRNHCLQPSEVKALQTLLQELRTEHTRLSASRLEGDESRAKSISALIARLELMSGKPQGKK